jgi:hypothetical protein
MGTTLPGSNRRGTPHPAETASGQRVETNETKSPDRRNPRETAGAYLLAPTDGIPPPAFRKGNAAMFRRIILPAALLALALGASQPAKAALNPNGLNSNGLTPNGLTQNSQGMQGLGTHGQAAGGATGGARAIAVELPSRAQ